MIAIEIENLSLKVDKLTLSVSEASRLVGCDKSVINSAIYSGELPFLIPNKRTQKRVSIFDLINYINNRSIYFEENQN